MQLSCQSWQEPSHKCHDYIIHVTQINTVIQLNQLHEKFLLQAIVHVLTIMNTTDWWEYQMSKCQLLWMFCMSTCLSVCLSVCLVVCMRVCVFACMRVCVYACMRVCVYACMRVCVYACMHACLPACMYICCMSVCLLYVCMNNIISLCTTRTFVLCILTARDRRWKTIYDPGWLPPQSWGLSGVELNNNSNYSGQSLLRQLRKQTNTHANMKTDTWLAEFKYNDLLSASWHNTLPWHSFTYKWWHSWHIFTYKWWLSTMTVSRYKWWHSWHSFTCKWWYSTVTVSHYKWWHSTMTQFHATNGDTLPWHSFTLQMVTLYHDTVSRYKWWHSTMTVSRYKWWHSTMTVSLYKRWHSLALH